MVAHLRSRFAAATLVLAAGLTTAVSAGEARWSDGVSYKNRNAVVAWGTGGAVDRGVAVWENERLGLMGRTLDARGEPSGTIWTLRANGALPTVPGEADVLFHREPAAAMDRSGRVFVAWTQEVVRIRTDYFYEERTVLERDVFAQVFDGQGQPLGDAFRVNLTAPGFQGRPVVVLLADRGDDLALVAWESEANDGAAPGVFARLYQTSSRKPVVGEFTVASGDARRAAAASLGTSALIGWEAKAGGTARGVFARSLGASTRVLGAVKQVGATSPFIQGQLALAPSGSGYLAAWVLSKTSTRTRLFARPLGVDGAPAGAQGPLTDGSARAESAPALAARGAQVSLVWFHWGRSLVEGVLGAQLTKTGRLAAPQQWLNENLPTAGAYRPTVTIAPDGSTIGVWQAPEVQGQWSIRSAKLER